jgi:hypothetical protein
MALQLEVRRGTNNPPAVKKIVYVVNYVQLPQKWMDHLARPKHRKMDMRFGMWNVRNLYRAGSLKAVARELRKYKLDLAERDNTEL